MDASAAASAAQRAQNHLYTRQSWGHKIGLENMRRLCAALSHPQRAQPIVTIAGTNGKGSTATLLHTALRAAGKRSGLYTSPHLLRFAERIVVMDQALDDALFVRLYQRLLDAETDLGAQLTFFECATALAFLAFAESHLDYAVMEVGLGGRLDAVNAADCAMALITPIALDHQAQLGPTLAHIAAEKAGVMRPHRPVIMAPQTAAAQAVLCARAEALCCEITVAPPLAAFLQPAADRQPPYQATNFALSWAAAQRLGIDAHAFLAAAMAFSWPGRYQTLGQAPLCIVDGAHNAAGMRAFVTAAQHDTRLRGRRLSAVFTSLQDKAGAPMVTILRELRPHLHLCPLPMPRSRTLAELRALAPDADLHSSPALALQAARHTAGVCGAVLVCGSLYLVAEAMALHFGVGQRPCCLG